MDARVVAIWQVLWPDGIPRKDYEVAMMQAALVNRIGERGVRKVVKEALAERRVTGLHTRLSALADADDLADFMTVKQICEALGGINPSNIHLDIRRGRLPVAKKGGGRIGQLIRRGAAEPYINAKLAKRARRKKR